MHERVDGERAEQVQQKWSPILGDERFVEACRKKVRESARLNRPDVPEGHRLAALDPDRIVAVACTHFGLSLPRCLVLLLCRELTPATGEALGGLFGVGPRTVSGLNHRTRLLVAREPTAQTELERLRAAIRSENK